MLENNVPNTEIEEVKEEAVVEPLMVCGIDLNKYDGKVSEEDVKTFSANAEKLTKLEIIRSMKSITATAKQIMFVRALAASAQSNTDMIQSFTDNMMKMVSNETNGDESEETAQTLTDIKSTFEAPKDDEDIDFDKTYAELDVYEAQLDAAIEILHLRYEELKKNGNTSIADDIAETLLKNRSTLENTTENLNAELYIKCIDTVIDELQSHSIDRMYPKANVPKKTLGIIKEFFKDVDRSIKEISKCGLSITWVRNFADFMWDEQSFSCKNDETTFSKGTYATVALVFFYHITKIVNSELKKQNYLSLIYKYYILQILEIQATTRMNEDQRFDENDEEIEVSKMRSAVFADYHKLFMMYITADIDQKLMIKNSAKLEAAIDRFIHPPRKGRTKPSEVEEVKQSIAEHAEIEEPEEVSDEIQE